MECSFNKNKNILNYFIQGKGNVRNYRKGLIFQVPLLLKTAGNIKESPDVSLQICRNCVVKGSSH